MANVIFPIANPIRVVVDLFDNYDNRLTNQNNYTKVQPTDFCQAFPNTLTLTPQVFTIYDTNTLQVKDLQGNPVGAPIPGVLVVSTGNGNFYSFEIDLSLLPVGYYVFEFTGTGASLPNYTGTSETIRIVESLPDHFLIEYYNFDNSYNFNYNTSQATSYLYVPGKVKNLRPEITDSTSFPDDVGRLILTSSFFRRNLEVQINGVPDWLYEKVLLSLCHDYKEFDGTRIGALEAGSLDVDIIQDEGILLNVSGTLPVYQYDGYNRNDSNKRVPQTREFSSAFSSAFA